MIDFKVGDLFTAPNGAFAHCVSADLKMGAGIAVAFRQRYGRPVGNPVVGGILVQNKGERFIYSLITKSVYNHTPSYDDLLSALTSMKSHAIDNGVGKVSMPLIGTGLDNLDPVVVSGILSLLFANEEQLLVTVYTLHLNPVVMMVCDQNAFIDKPLYIVENTKKIGSHISWRGSLMNTINMGDRMGMSACQLTLAGSPMSWKQREVPDLKEAAEFCEANNFTVVSHLPYILNMAGGVNERCDDNLARCSDLVVNQLSYLAQMNGCAVIHPGSRKTSNKGTREQGMKDAAMAIYDCCNSVQNSKLFMEICAGEGTKFPVTADECRVMLEAIPSAGRTGICVDTAHVWGSGDHDIDSTSGIDSMWEAYTELGVDIMWHFNDSSACKGSCKDRHAGLRRGRIWSDNGEPLAQLFEMTSDQLVIIESATSDFLNTLDINGCNGLKKHK